VRFDRSKKRFFLNLPTTQAPAKASAKEARTISDYIKSVIMGKPLIFPYSRSEAIIALKAARTAVACVAGRGSVHRQNIQAELKRIGGGQ